jgi:hypothetical protein
MQRAVFGNPASPYLPLLRRAGCGYADMADGVRATASNGCCRSSSARASSSRSTSSRATTPSAAVAWSSAFERIDTALDWMFDMRQRRGRCALQSYVSQAVRLSRVARERCVDQ